MSQRSEVGMPAIQDLSALADGELDPAQVAGACQLWRDDPLARRQWHAYQLIGDVLRSEDLASDGARDAAFLGKLRARLADEPVVLAPSQIVADAARGHHKPRRAWAAPAAVAAGFAVVAGTLLVTQMAGGLSWPGSSSDASLARAMVPGAPGVVRVELAPSAMADAAGLQEDQFVRDVRLDEYLAAHKKFGGSSVPGGPAGFLRNAAVSIPAR